MDHLKMKAGLLQELIEKLSGLPNELENEKPDASVELLKVSGDEGSELADALKKAKEV